MSTDLASFFDDLDLAKVRFRRPSKFVFLCGGRTPQTDEPPASLRDYIYRVRRIEQTIGSRIVLAESAIQLYRDTKYADLISFEEDIARISALVLLIAESPGSLTELGAFSSNESIRKTLRIIIHQKHEDAESFIRFGPIQRQMNLEKRESVGFFPWRITKTKRFVKASGAPHYSNIKRFIAKHLEDAPSSELFNESNEKQKFFLIYWIVFLGFALTWSELHKYALALAPTLSRGEIRNKLYCMRLAGWLDKLSYSGKDYYFVCDDKDPFDYAFKPGISISDSVRRKFELGQTFLRDVSAPKHVREVAASARHGV